MKKGNYIIDNITIIAKRDNFNDVDTNKMKSIISKLRDIAKESGITIIVRVPKCNHSSVKGDNYGTTCTDCGEILSGYGYGGWFGRNLPDPLPECKHQFVSYNDDEICMFCETIRKREEK